MYFTQKQFLKNHPEGLKRNVRLTCDTCSGLKW